MKDEIELEDWVASDRDRPIPEARRYRVRLWDGDGFDEKRVLTDPMPTGHQILDLFDRGPADEHVLLMLSRSSGLDSSEEHTSSLQSTIRLSSAVFILKKKTQTT